LARDYESKKENEDPIFPMLEYPWALRIISDGKEVGKKHFCFVPMVSGRKKATCGTATLRI
jgi:hypothetical protein